ncbi:hypothetical protein J2S34_000219 [Nitrobacter winogradskyi]|uniref:Uncharacterized protein n=1 Tax=Nitrobacter winogradskyi TaxID=913 RepID=A0ACC6AE66_NITWI|nr:hypothetical protein [Nitrobacter winogradskyi]
MSISEDFQAHALAEPPEADKRRKLKSGPHACSTLPHQCTGRTGIAVANCVSSFMMRLKSSIWVAAYLRRCQGEGVFGAVRRRGADEAGAVFVKLALLDGNAMLYAPAPQAVYDDSRPVERVFAPSSAEPVAEQAIEDRLAREVRFDPDAWIVEIEDKAGRHFLDLARG